MICAVARAALEVAPDFQPSIPSRTLLTAESCVSSDSSMMLVLAIILARSVPDLECPQPGSTAARAIAAVGGNRESPLPRTDEPGD